MTDDPVLAVAVRAARRAEAVLADAARDLRRLPSHATGHDDLVANAVLEAEYAIIATLRGGFPDHAIAGREAGEVVGRGGAETDRPSAFRWIVDPLDGAGNFAHGYPHYAISLALAHGENVTHAIVLDPAYDDLYTAVRGKGAQRNGMPIRTATCSALDRALVGTASPRADNVRSAAYLPLLYALETRCPGVRLGGTCALGLAYVAAGRLDGFWMVGGRQWDVCAGALLVAEAGGRIGNFAGGEDYLRAGELIASTTALFTPLREAIATAPR